ncbi:MAG: hypothetical protein AAGI63_06935 [Planctomycetota bacterium]
MQRIRATGMLWVQTLLALVSTTMLPSTWTLPSATAADPDTTANHAANPMPSYTGSANLRTDASLVAVDFVTPQLGLACGDHGAIWRTMDSGNTWSLVESGVSCRLEDILWLTASRAVIVGGSYDPMTRISRAVVLRSDDGGETWHRGEDGELPKLLRLKRSEDGAIIAEGDWSHSLLTNQIESRNAGRTWDGGIAREHDNSPKSTESLARIQQWVRVTGVPVVMRDACPLADESYCAVGDHGVIQRTDDGGKNWRVVQGGDRRTCILMVSKDPTTVAWPMIGSESLQNRHRTALLLHDGGVHDHTIGVPRQVMAMLGGSAVDRFATVADHDATSKDNAEKKREAFAAAANAWMKIHRPLVLVIDEQLDTFCKEVLLQSASTAGVSRVVHYSYGSTGTVTLHRDALLAGAGMLASDLQLDAMHLIAPEQAISRSISVKSVYDLGTGKRRGDTLTSALSVHTGHRLQSPAPAASRRRLQMAQARLAQSRRVDEFLSQSMKPERFRTALRGIFEQTANEDRLRVAWSVLGKVQAKRVSRRIHQATLDEIAETFADHSVSGWAQLRSGAMQSSREWSLLGLSSADIRQSGEAFAGGGTSAAAPVSPFQIPPSGVAQASNVVPLLVPDRTPEYSINEDSATESETEAAEVDLNWEFHPLVLLSRDAARRRGDEATLQPAEGMSSDLARLAEVPVTPWSRLMFTRSHEVSVRRAQEPPHLDGLLDDPCWQTALRRAGNPTELRLAYDDSYLYAAIEIPAEQFGEDTADRSGTIRDHDLRDVDRVRIRFDSDRDLITSMQLQVSAAGRTHDAIDANPAWQPTWYVATKCLEDRVVIELALSRHDVADLPIPVGEIWFTSVELVPAGSVAGDPVIPHPEDWKRIVFQP